MEGVDRVSELRVGGRGSMEKFCDFLGRICLIFFLSDDVRDGLLGGGILRCFDVVKVELAHELEGRKHFALVYGFCSHLFYY